MGNPSITSNFRKSAPQKQLSCTRRVVRGRRGHGSQSAPCAAGTGHVDQQDAARAGKGDPRFGLATLLLPRSPFLKNIILKSLERPQGYHYFSVRVGIDLI